MTEDEVRQRVAAIDDIADSAEKAHIEEDRLYCDVLEAIAAGAVNPVGLARAALAARNLDMDRYYSAPTE